MGKAAGAGALCTEMIKCLPMYAIERLCCLFNRILKVYYTPNNFSSVCLVPIIKKKNRDTTCSDNFRYVAIAYVLSNLFDSVPLKHISVQCSVVNMFLASYLDSNSNYYN